MVASSIAGISIMNLDIIKELHIIFSVCNAQKDCHRLQTFYSRWSETVGMLLQTHDLVKASYQGLRPAQKAPKVTQAGYQMSTFPNIFFLSIIGLT